MNKIYRVVIIPGNGSVKEKHVVARNEKAALLAVIEQIPEGDPIWQAPGWRHVETFEATRPFILKGTVI
jgi:hypothetical protein